MLYVTDLDERPTLAFADLFAKNRIRFLDGAVEGGPDHYDVCAAAVAADGSEVELQSASKLSSGDMVPFTGDMLMDYKLTNPEGDIASGGVDELVYKLRNG
jgi:hypothetical protein